MKIKDKMRNIRNIIILAIIIIIGICAISIPYVTAVVNEGNSAAKAEIFKDDLGILNSKEHPTHLFADYGIYLFCGAHKWDVDGFMTATQAHYTAWKNKSPIGKAEYDENNPYYLYARSETVGLYNSYKGEFNRWKATVKGLKSVSPAYQDDQGLIDSLKGSLPGISKPVVKSIEYTQVGQYDTKTYIDAAFILTQQKVYDNAKIMPKNKENITPDEQEKGYFNVDEKQYALWETDINVGAGNDGDDRNLGDIAKKFKEFYKIIKSSGYGSIINAIGEGIEQTSVGMGENKAYKFKEAKVEVDSKNNKYIYGPFCLDYAVDDEAGDIYKSTPTNQVKFNAIEEIRIYDKNKNDITEASNFQIVYEYKGGSTEGQKLRRISDEKWYAKANYEEVKAFESSKPFYIVVDASNLNPEQLKGIYAKVGLQYLDEVTATMYEYEGNVVKYFYKEGVMASQNVTHTARYEKDGSHSETCPEGCESDHKTEGSTSKTFSIKTTGFTLNRAYSGEKAQKMVGYACDGTRTYKTYSVVLTTDWDDTGDTKIELEKICDNTNKPLAGAEYEVTLEINGQDAHRNSINKTMKFYRTTDAKGKISITSSEIAIEGVYLGTFTGEIKAKFHETKAPAGHKLGKGDAELTVSVTNGNGSGSVTAKNEHVDNPVIQIAKVNEDGKKIEEASFKIHVIYKVGNNAEVDDPYNIIGGTTEKGYLRLTREDFKKLKKGFDFGTNFTGYITLQISEIGAPNNFSLSSNNLSVTLHYEKGKLVKREASENPSVVVDYAYKNWTENIQNWINAERSGKKFTMYSYVEENVKAWIKKQQTEHPELEYADILNYLEQYVKEIDEKIKNNEMSNPVLEDWDVATKVQGNNNVVQIVFKDTPGNFEIPDIEITLDNMDLGGKVFWDYTENKDGKESNGLYDEGEKSLYGIEVNLTGSDGSFRRTITNRNGEYLFKGLNPLKKYTVTFKYNGIQFEAKRAENVGEYNSAQWAISSKGAEISSPRDSFKTINKNNPAFTYEELEGLYEEIANYRWSVINSGSECPSLEDAVNHVKGNHGSDKDINAKVEYIKKAVATSSAGQYPVYDKFILDYEGANAGSTTVEFAGDTVPYIYPGQLQIHQALVRRDKTDLELTTNIVETTVSMNRYDTTYGYNVPNNGSYHQYIYKEDYNYDTKGLKEDGTQREDGIAYYTEDNVHFYVTYESTIKNFTYSNTRLTQIIDYYNKEFNWKASYTTTKGTQIPGIEVIRNGGNCNYTVADGARPNGYKSKIVTLLSDNGLNSPSDEIKIRLTYELVGDTGENGNAKDVLAKYLFRNNEYGEGKEELGMDISYAMEINHYAEIAEYKTDSAYIDRDSHPGNFDVEAYERAIVEYQKAREEYKKNPSEENRLVAQTRKEELTKMREDDTGTVTLTLSNSGTVRTLTGNVWEAIDGQVKDTVDLQTNSTYGDRYVTHDSSLEKALGGIKVELVELVNPEDKISENEETQVVRAVTRTNEDGSYEFKSYIAGDYTVRFVYGDFEDKDQIIRSKITTGSEGQNTTLPINGQYYQSTKANPNTDKLAGNDVKYWYYNNTDKNRREDDILIPDNAEYEKRYSDAYDDSYSRLSQMKATVIAGEGINNSTSTEYNYDGNIEVQDVRVTDPIYAYTSTMNLEVEYVRPSVIGNKGNSWYKYGISNVDFGVTPRAYNDVNVSRYVSNVKLYVEGSNEPLINSYFNEAGNREEGHEDEKGRGYINDTIDSNAYLDGLIKINYEELLAQRAHLELTYSVKVSNDSRYDDKNKIYDTIKYIYQYGDNTGEIVGVSYYDEEVSKLTNYETRGVGTETQGTIIYHNKLGVQGNGFGNLAKENRNQATYKENSNRTERLSEYNVVTGTSTPGAKNITSKVETIIDYPTVPLDFNGTNKLGEEINKDWLETDPKEFVSSREDYKIEHGDISLVGKVGDENSLMTQSHILIAKPLSTEDDNPANLYANLLPGETRETTLVLQHTLATSTEEISDDPSQDITGNDIEYSNLVEITRLSNTAGKIVDIEGYDINGEESTETSKVHDSALIGMTTGKYEKENTTVTVDVIKADKVELTPTLSTGKSQTTQITPPAGLPKAENIFAYTGIALIVLSILAGGIVLIKKYVIVKIPKA